ncbi:MAG: hypothetical protein HYR96_02975, partial [Deltaproteobacteria bacterium]|nr:hypothetical protein [Deltaproteobacteria bacterium]
VELLSELRVVALKADQPEVAAGTTVTITPVVSDFKGGGRALTYSVSGCLDPASIGEQAERCDSRADRVEIAASTGVTGLSSPHYTGAINTFSVTVPPAVLTLASGVQKANGWWYLVQFALTASDGATVTAVKRILVSNRGTVNTNPTLTSVIADGAALATLPTDRTTLSASVPAASKQSYTLTFSDGSTKSQDESLAVRWFITSGTLTSATTGTEGTTDWQSPTAPATLVTVLSDGRGGTDYQIFSSP